MEARYQNEIPGFNNRMTEIAAAIGLVQLRKIEKWTLARQANAAFLDENLDGVGVPKVAVGAKHVYHQYTISLGDLDRYRFASELKKLGVDSDIYYPIPVHALPAYSQVHDLPMSLLASKTCLSIPVHQNLRKADLHHIVQSVNLLAKSGA
jgi:dTDP-4-amino-4,6-dideoxygalactose transaminase